MSDEETTTITISTRARERLEKLKEHPRVSAGEIVDRLLDFHQRYKGVVEGESVRRR